MYKDIVVPNNNEAEFVEIALKLGIAKLSFLYNFDKHRDEEKIQDKLSHVQNSGISTEIGFVVSHKNLDRAAKHSRLLAAKSSGNDRILVESKKIKLVYGFEEASKKDYLHQRASGLNHTLCELAKKNNIAVGFSYGSLLSKSNAETSLLIGRMMQNISLCKKYKVKTIIGSFSEEPLNLRAPHDIAALFTTFGMDAKAIKNSMGFDF